MRQYRASGRDARKKEHQDLDFVGVDGEGGNLASGYHAYFLLSAGDSRITPSAGNARLTTEECLRFLTSLDPSKLYVAYYFDYDVTKILEDLGWTKLERLINRNLRTREDGKGCFPVDYRGFQVDYLPRKEFKVRRMLNAERERHNGERPVWGPWIVINDVGSFFQCKFTEALEKWRVGSDEEQMDVARGKEGRANFELKDLAEIIPYNTLEIKLLQSLMGKFRDACKATGYVPARWQGPGLLAEAMLSAHGVRKSRDIALFSLPEKAPLLTFASNAFYGGRPEISAIGPVNRRMFQFDINSAYPYAMQFLPCLEHGSWENFNYDKPTYVTDCNIPRGVRGEIYALHFGDFCDTLHSDFPHTAQHFNRPTLYGLPIRTEQGTIVYPAAGQGWYWSFEIQSAIHQSFKVRESWVYTRVCDCRPLGFVADVYQQRLAMGKDGPGIVLKLGLNSLFGKSVQSVGSPKYSNPIWGSFITAYCRMMIQDFQHSSEWCTDMNRQCGRDIVMIATDSVCTFNPRDDIEISSQLGGWSCETHERGMFLVQPGLYFGSSGQPIKTRGVPRNIIAEKERDFRDAFDRMAESHRLAAGDVRVPQRMFVGIRYALHRHNLKLLGQWIEFVDSETGEEGKVIRFDWSSKRARHPVLEPLPGVHDYIETYPQEGSMDVCTLPYSKDIGGLRVREDLRLAFADQPDWAGAIEMSNE